MKKRVFLIFSLILLIGLCTGCGNNKDLDNNIGNETNNGEGNNVVDKSQEIVKLYLDYDSVTALSANGMLYGIGAVDGLGEDVEKTEEITLLASNVKDFKEDLTLYYIDNNNTLYRTGWDYDGGILGTFVKTYDKVNFFNASSSFCLSVVDENGSYYINNGMNIGDYCGLYERTDGFKKIADNVKQSISSYYYNGYVDSNDDLYISVKDNEYSKILSNVVDYSVASIGVDYYLTSNNEVYKVVVDYATREVTVDLLETDVVELGDNFIKKTDGKYYIYIEEDKIVDLANNNQFVDKSDYYMIDAVDDIKDIYYYNKDRNYFVYLNVENKIVLYDRYKEEKYKIVDNVIESMEDIYNFVS